MNAGDVLMFVGLMPPDASGAIAGVLIQVFVAAALSYLLKLRSDRLNREMQTGAERELQAFRSDHP